MSITTAPSFIRRWRTANRPASKSGWNRAALIAVLFFAALFAVEMALIYAAAPAIDVLRDFAATP